MKQKIIVITTASILAVCACYLQFGKEMDVVNSISLNSSNYRNENIKVILNKAIVTESKEDIAADIIQKVLNNDFHTIRFCFDDGYPNRLDVSVYKNEKDRELGNLLFAFSYKQDADDEIGAYDISQSDHMQLEIHE